MQLAKTFDWEAHFLVPVSPILQFSVREISVPWDHGLKSPGFSSQFILNWGVVHNI